MKWDLYPQTLMSEYHIRYGGYGGIGYYLVSDNYIALMSRFTTCGSWEGHYILDFLQENKSEVQPDTIHADTQGQSTAIFGLAYLLGIELMPRIRNWKDQHLFRPAPDVSYQHIDELFTAQVDWDLIATLIPDMMRVAVSIRTGNILPSDILRRLNSSSRKNKLAISAPLARIFHQPLGKSGVEPAKKRGPSELRSASWRTCDKQPIMASVQAWGDWFTRLRARGADTLSRTKWSSPRSSSSQVTWSPALSPIAAARGSGK